jgi:metallo-beta-lactamase class B
MMKRKLFILSFLILSAYFCSSTDGQQIERFREMNRPFKPFRIIGNIHYVGASDVTSFLITTPQGHILLDSGFQETVPQIKKNVAELGFRLEDIKILLTSHAHTDHVGGMAELKQITKATLMVSAPDAELLARGGKDDFAFGDEYIYPAVKPDRILRDKETIELGGVKMTAYITSGHTKGNTSWIMKVNEDGKQYDAVFVGSITAPGYQLVENKKYPEIVADYRKTFERLKALPCDVFLGSHGQFFSLKEKSSLVNQKTNPFIDPQEYKSYLARSEESFNNQLEQQQKSKPSR